MTNLEQAKKLAKLAPPLSRQELERINALYPAYLFRRRRTREVWTTCCHRHEVLPEECSDAQWAVLEAEHWAEPKCTAYHCHCGMLSAPTPKQPAEVSCPFCGRAVRVKELGRTGKRDNLASYRRVVFLRWYRGALWARAVYTRKKYPTEDSLTELPDYDFGKVYRFRPGMAEATYGAWYGGPLTGMVTLGEPPKKLPLPFHEPFPHSSEFGIGYDLLGLEAVEHSPFRYCGLQQFQRSSSSIMRFLAVCCLYPRQVEMLMKAGLWRVVDDLAQGHRWNRRAFNWAEPDPLKSFQLDKLEMKLFLAGNRDLEQLVAYKGLRTSRLACTFEQLQLLWKWSPYGKAPKVVSRLRKYSLPPARLLSYIQREKGTKGQKRTEMTDLVGQWLDYVDAAEVLGYDMKNPVMLTPKGLCAKHDAATRAAGPILEARRNSQSVALAHARARELSARYTFSTDRWLIRPPVSAGEIVAEGKALRHCVGGYAARYINGQTVLLFLRDRKRPGVSMATIEMRGDQIAQIHGLTNDRYAKVKPMEKYAEILEPWLEWLAKGSKRDKTGRPKLPKKKKVGVA